MNERTISFSEGPTLQRRIHVGIAVSDVQRSVAFYSTLFGQEPTKTRDGYAKFEVLDPPVNFTLNRYADPPGSIGPQHFGIQVRTADSVAAARAQLEAAGLTLAVEEGVTCCYAVQDKVWAIDPDGHRWEVFFVLDPDAPVHSSPSEAQTSDEPCCAPTCCS